MGDTNWESYDLPTLIAMVTEKVNIPNLIELADDWRQAGDEMRLSARKLGNALDGMMDFWSGAAAEQARKDVELNAEWVAGLGDTAYDIGRPVEDAAGALKAAQDQMPNLPAATPTTGSAPQGAANGGLAGGPLGEAIGGVAEGSQSAAQAVEAEAKLKRQAVETMRRFEAAAMGIDQSIPQFEGPTSTLHPDPVRTPRPPKPPATTELTLVTDVSMSWQQLTGSRSSETSAQGVGEHGGGSHGGSFGGGGGAAFGSPAPEMVRGTGSGTAAGPMAERGPGAMPAAASAMPIDPDGHPGGMGGAPMAGGMGAGAGGGTGNDHRRRFPFEADDPFALDEKASPPVIGL